MVTFTVKEKAYVRYSLTTWQGEAEYEGETLRYRFSEDDNGQEAFVWTDEGWSHAHPFCAVILATVSEWGSPEEFGHIDEKVEIDDEILEDYM